MAKYIPEKLKPLLKKIVFPIPKNLSRNFINISEKDTARINEEKVLPGSSEPQDLGSISYKDTLTGQENQEIQSIEKSLVVNRLLYAENDKLMILLRDAKANLYQSLRREKHQYTKTF